jgi:acetyl-CoA carboxylase biotin carboxyl carrier protein
MSSSGGTSSGDPFDIRKIRRIIELMKEHDLAEIDLRQSDQRIRLRRGADVITVAGAVPPPQVSPAPPREAAAGGSTEDPNSVYVRSPMVGTYYAAASPESPAFVKVGDQVGPETTVCIIEAMKVFNEIPAECSGKIVEVLLQSGASVEFGQPLFRLQKSG